MRLACKATHSALISDRHAAVKTWAVQVGESMIG